MRNSIHHLVLYGLGSVTFFILGFTVDRSAAAVPFVSQIHVLPTPSESSVFDQRTRGGQAIGRQHFCAAQTRLLLSSDRPSAELQAHYSRNPILTREGKPTVGKVRPASEVKDLVPEWQRHKKDPNVFVVEFTSPGTPGAHMVCGI